MVATQLNEMVSSGQLAEFTIVKINRYITSLFNASDKERYYTALSSLSKKDMLLSILFIYFM